jgi:hypothetical protein
VSKAVSCFPRWRESEPDEEKQKRPNARGERRAARDCSTK